MSITQNGIKLHNKRKGYCCVFLFNALELVLSVILIVTLSAHIIFPEQARGALGVSNALSYQGRLTDTSGNPLGGSGTNYCFSFSIFDASSGGSKLWPSSATTTSTLMVTNGIFNTSISPVDSFDFSSNNTTYLNVDVATQSAGTCTGVSWEALAPRQKLDSVAYARVAAEVYGTTLQTSSSTNSVIIGPAAGVAGTSTLLYLGIKTSAGPTFTSVGQSCAGYNGAIWYNSATTRALVCENNTVRALSNATTTIDAISTPLNTYNSGTVMISGGNNITVTTNGQTISISGANQSVQTQNLQSIVLSSNTAGVMATISSGQMILAGGNNITLSQNGNAVTISGGAGGGGAAIAASGIATTFTSGTVVFSGGNLMSISTGAGQAVIVSNLLSSATTASAVGTTNVIGVMASRFALEGHQHAGIPVAGISGGNTLNTSGTYYGSLMFAGGNNITLSAVTGAGGQTITIVGAAGGAGFANYIAAGTVTANGLNTINFSNANGVSFGLNVGANSSVMTASVNPGGGGGVTLSHWEPYLLATSTAVSSLAPASIWFNTINLPEAVAISRVNLVKSFNMSVASATSVASTGTEAFTYSQGFSIFTRQNYGANSTNLSVLTTASVGMTFQYLYSSTSQSLNVSYVTNSTGGISVWQSTSNASNLASYWTGLKYLPVPLVTTLTAGEYWIGYRHSSTTGTTQSNVTAAFISNLQVTFPAMSLGRLNVAGSQAGWAPGKQGHGYASAFTTNNTMAMSVISSASQQFPYFNFVNY